MDHYIDQRESGIGYDKIYQKNITKQFSEMINNNIGEKLNKNILFVKYFEPYDFTKHMGQLAVEITYTDGDTQMLTTKSTKENVCSSYEFSNEREFYDFIDFLKDNHINRKPYK